MYEVEFKYPLPDPAAVERRLIGLAAEFSDRVEQVDRYFSHPCRDFARTDEALRLRRTGDAIAVTWKGPRIGTAAKTRREIELPLASATLASSRATLEQWSDLLGALGFGRVLEVAKYRRSAQLSWEGAEIEVAIDAVAGLGDFLEGEILAEEGEVPAAVRRLESLARELGCGPPEQRSYLEMLLAEQSPH